MLNNEHYNYKFPINDYKDELMNHKFEVKEYFIGDLKFI